MRVGTRQEFAEEVFFGVDLRPCSDSGVGAGVMCFELGMQDLMLVVEGLRSSPRHTVRGLFLII